MLSKWSWFMLNLIVCANTAPSDTRQNEAFLELLELDYEDQCKNTAELQWLFINSPSNETLSSWEEQQNSYAEFKKHRKAEVHDIKKDNIKKDNIKKKHISSFLYKHNVIEKPGDELIEEDDWKQLVHFAGVVELQRSTISYISEGKNYSRKDVEHLLSHIGKPEDKETAWTTWYHQLKPLVANYSNNLPLIAKAAKENGAENVENYWEMLSGYLKAYEKIDSDWSRINTLHKNILKFISANLSKKYGITLNNTISAHLLGSLQGYDWADLSSDVLPYSNLIYDIKKNLWSKKIVGKSLYKTASNLGSILLKQVPQAKFWSESKFNRQCPSRLLNLCQDGIMRVSTCSEASASNFLAAHKDVGRILFNQITIESTPILNTANRFSALEESTSVLFGILSASPTWLNHTHLMDVTEEDNEKHTIVSLMITALNTLPQLAYYYSADKWRINAIKKNITDPEELVSSWWKYRQEYEGVTCNNADSPTFLDDSYIVSNKPYLPKILGVMLAFQLYEHTLESYEVRYDDIDGKLINNNIIKMIQHGGADNWLEVLDKFLEIDEISADALISYFSRLEEFLEENEEFEYKSGSREDKELGELEKRVLQEINAPPPPPPTAASVTTKITEPSSKTNNANQKQQLQIKNSLESSAQKDESKSFNSSEPNPQSKPSADKSLTPDTSDDKQNKSQIDTSKTIWAVSAVLIAVIIICTIAIFGRRRCRKIPKNRR